MSAIAIDGDGDGTVSVAPRRAAAIGLLAYVLLSPLLARNTVVVCPFRRLTGHACPFCGLTRSVAALLAGDLRRSVASHPLGWTLVVATLEVWLRPAEAMRMIATTRGAH